MKALFLTLWMLTCLFGEDSGRDPTILVHKISVPVGQLLPLQKATALYDLSVIKESLVIIGAQPNCGRCIAVDENEIKSGVIVGPKTTHVNLSAIITAPRTDGPFNSALSLICETGEHKQQIIELIAIGRVDRPLIIPDEGTINFGVFDSGKTSMEHQVSLKRGQFVTKWTSIDVKYDRSDLASRGINISYSTDADNVTAKVSIQNEQLIGEVCWEADISFILPDGTRLPYVERVTNRMQMGALGTIVPSRILRVGLNPNHDLEIGFTIRGNDKIVKATTESILGPPITASIQNATGKLLLSQIREGNGQRGYIELWSESGRCYEIPYLLATK